MVITTKFPVFIVDFCVECSSRVKEEMTDEAHREISDGRGDHHGDKIPVKFPIRPSDIIQSPVYVEGSLISGQKLINFESNSIGNQRRIVIFIFHETTQVDVLESDWDEPEF